MPLCLQDRLVVFLLDLFQRRPHRVGQLLLPGCLYLELQNDALGYIPGREEGQAVEAGTDFAFSGTGAEGVGTKPSSENRETMQGPGEAEE